MEEYFKFRIKKSNLYELLRLRDEYLRIGDSEGFLNNEFTVRFFEGFEKLVKKYETKAQPKA